MKGGKVEGTEERRGGGINGAKQFTRNREEKRKIGKKFEEEIKFKTSNNIYSNNIRAS
jgi:hypothetical protein